MKKRDSFNTILFFLITLLGIVFYNKFIYLAPNLNVSIGLIIYAFSFLVLVYLYKNTSIKYAKETIFSVFAMLLVFYFLVTILNSIDSITDSKLISDNLRNIFTPNAVDVKGYFLYYPHVSAVITYPVVFFLSHYIFITTYEALEEATNYIIGFVLAILMSFILDQVIYTPLVNAHKLINGLITYPELIRQLTANFIVVIFMSIMLLFIYALRREKRNR